MSEPDIQVGDRITVPSPVLRKWWQFWKPRIIEWRQDEYVCTAVSGGLIELNGDKHITVIL